MRTDRAGSDIDLPVEGGKRAQLERIAAGLSQSVDIVRFDELRPGVLDRVLSEGIVLYETK